MATCEQLANLLGRVRKALEDGDVAGLRKVSVAAIEATAMDDGEDTLLVAIIAYMLSKLISKTHYWKAKERKCFIQSTVRKMDRCIAAVGKADIHAYRKAMGRIMMGMRELELSDPRYVSDLEAKTRTKLASRLYAQGFSLSRAVALTGAHKQDLMILAGRTLIPDRSGKTMPLKERLKKVRELFAQTTLPDGDEAWTC